MLASELSIFYFKFLRQCNVSSRQKRYNFLFLDVVKVKYSMLRTLIRYHQNQNLILLIPPWYDEL